MENYENNEFLLSFIEEWTKIVEKFNGKTKSQKNESRYGHYRPFEAPILRKFREISILTGIDETSLKKIYNIAKKYREIVVKNNVGLVKKVVWDFIKKFNCTVQKDELYNSGLIGLTRTVDNYREEYKAKFSTYAQQNIWRDIEKCYLLERNAIHIPLDIQRDWQGERRRTQDHKSEIIKARNVQSLNYLTERYEADEDKLKIASIFAECQGAVVLDTPEAVLMELEKAELIEELLSHLNEAEREIIEGVFGFSGTVINLSEYGRRHNVSRMTAKNRFDKAIKKLQKVVQSMKIDTIGYLLK